MSTEWLGLLLSIGGALLVLLLLGFARYWISRPQAAFHSGGETGLCRDIALDLSGFLPLFLAGIAIRIVGIFDPSTAGDPKFLALLLFGYVGILFARRFGPIKAARERLKEAQSKRWDAARNEAPHA